MQRIRCQPRPDWQSRVESQGLHFHTADDKPYWDESVCYEFTTSEIDRLERATDELHELCVQAVTHIFDHSLFERFQIPDRCVGWLRQSWERDERTLYGRFDFAFDGRDHPKLLEFNADTPTALLEAAVVQWYWLKDTQPDADQFNSIHERLIEFWQSWSPGGLVHFTSLRDHLEDFMTVNYLRDTAVQAGLQTEFLPIDGLGYNSASRQFVDMNNRPVRHCFKLYPWEWMIHEQFGAQLPAVPTRWLEPPWKMLMSHKTILAVLWELFPECPYLLQAGEEPIGDSFVCKPVCGREGANVTVTDRGRVVAATDGDYGDSPMIYQELARLTPFDGRYAIVGSWVVDGASCGIGVREDDGPVTRNTSRFVPHWFKP